MTRSKGRLNQARPFDHIRSILKQSLSGLEMKVVEHTDEGLVGLEGLILEDSKNTFLLQTSLKTVRVSKNYGKFKFRTNHLIFTASSKVIIGTAKQRRKRKLRDW